jgi:hypothetical protein
MKISDKHKLDSKNSLSKIQLISLRGGIVEDIRCCLWCYGELMEGTCGRVMMGDCSTAPNPDPENCEWKKEEVD